MLLFSRSIGFASNCALAPTGLAPGLPGYDHEQMIAAAKLANAHAQGPWVRGRDFLAKVKGYSLATPLFDSPLVVDGMCLGSTDLLGHIYPPPSGTYCSAAHFFVGFYGSPYTVGDFFSPYYGLVSPFRVLSNSSPLSAIVGR